MSLFSSRVASPQTCRKRQRLSSPTYDDQIGDMTQEDIEAFDAFEAQLSQASNYTSKPQSTWGSSQPQESPTKIGASFLKASSLTYDSDNPFNYASGHGQMPEKARVPTAPVAFASASSLLSSALDDGRSPSPEFPPDDSKYDDWFRPASPSAMLDVPVFTTPKMPMIGFSKASNKGIIMPSKDALAKAKARMESWTKEFVEPDTTEQENMLNIIPPSFDTPTRPNGLQNNRSKANSKPFAPLILNSINVPSTLSAPAFTRPSLDTFPVTPNTSNKSKPFKTPFLKQPHTPNHASVGSPLNSQCASLGFTSAASHLSHPLSALPVNAPLIVSNPSDDFSTPLRKKIRTTPAPFKTPFKPGFRLPLASSVTRGSPLVRKDSPPPPPHSVQHPPENVLKKPVARKQFFCLTVPGPRQTLASSGLYPQQYNKQELEDMGIDVSTLSQITPETAKYYHFSTVSMTSPSYASGSKAIYGPTEALKELLQRGCSLATRPWVDNHWSLILWKLAGMVLLDPQRENKAGEIPRWCWPHVIDQLLYRYERELHGGSRPPLRKIVNQDAPAALPMVLCVSNIFWSPSGITEDGAVIESYPELEITDGWYRLRAQVDPPMARAVKNGIIRIGRKIGFAGATLSTDKKEASEILEAYESTCLILSGNSAHLMPWHAKLGFTRGPSVSTLHSLNPDGGLVVALDFVITKLYPIAFLEFTEDVHGNKERIGPFNEAEEMEVNEKWKKRYETEASKLREEYEKKFVRYSSYADRLERKAGTHFQRIMNSDDHPPEKIDAMYDELEYTDTAAAIMARTTSAESAWLALHIRRQNERSRELIGEEIEKELLAICPPRNVRSFRVLIIQDARTSRRPANRTAQLTVWDVVNITLDEDSKAGAFEIGQRFMATNLFPQQQSAWMDCSPGSEVYLCTRRDTRWTRIKTIV